MNAVRFSIASGITPHWAARHQLRGVRVGRHFAADERWWGGWALTHLPTGYRAGKKYPSRDDAARRAQALEALPIDWAALRDGRSLDAALRQQVRCILGIES